MGMSSSSHPQGSFLGASETRLDRLRSMAYRTAERYGWWCVSQPLKVLPADLSARACARDHAVGRDTAAPRSTGHQINPMHPVARHTSGQRVMLAAPHQVALLVAPAFAPGAEVSV